jgi:hypothetical protein
VNRVIGSEVDTLQRESFSYFEHEVNAVNGLVIDKTAPNSPANIATTGFAQRTAVAIDAAVILHRQRPAASGVWPRLALDSYPRSRDLR